MVNLSDLVATSQDVASTRARTAKVAALATLLEKTAPDALEVVVSYLGGQVRQRRTGVGWRSLGDLPAPAEVSTLDVVAVDAALEEIAAFAGPGSQAARTQALHALFGSATAAEQAWLRGAITGELRQGASDALVQEALAVRTGLPVADIRRAAMLAGSTRAVAGAAVAGGAAALAAIGLEVGRPILPMLAASAPTVAEALAKLGASPDHPVAVEAKLDGIRIQAHRRGDDVLVVSRSLDDLTARLPAVVDVVRSLPGGDLVLDGEALLTDDAGRARPFQETSSRSATHGEVSPESSSDLGLQPYFFDVLHRDGRDLLDVSAAERAAELADLVPPAHRLDRVVTGEPASAEQFVENVLRRGHEGVVVKDLAAPYAAGRRGSAWVKVKPVHTLDLVVLAVEWGSGRRRGWLSNIHLGARDPGGTDDFVMVGKTFKGMTDAMLTWQTERFLALETHREGHVVHVRPEQVVEIAIDGVQRSTRYAGGAALRFARVVGYREDKSPGEADTIDAVRALLH
ncbi:ATP-dependent DNA ligase [Nocardioides sp. R-C-SC26]|uniref:ATP-dependent DNA ligase n=1 Tax=Nocardioides sp. R-C-SC26 TaxID=2870414 RepID=UPI0027E1EA8D|nr:ATP-dependent DNA ligase [Nocardioides sp. R-C-SC26]